MSKQRKKRRNKNSIVAVPKMQAKISAFFKPSRPSQPDTSPHPNQFDKDILLMEDRKKEILVTYKRRTPNTILKADNEDDAEMQGSQVEELNDGSLIGPSPASKTLNKKRSFAQYHLELGQSDFLLHTCSTCGLKYACGDEMDDKVHSAFHKKYCQGISFKGWPNERVVSAPTRSGNRIVLILDADPSYQKHKVQEVLKMMERDLSLSSDWMLHKHCKVYLYISNKKIVGALVAEPIGNAHRIISTAEATSVQSSKSNPTTSDGSNTKSSKPNSTVLQFGLVSFHREISKRHPSNAKEPTLGRDGAILCEKEVVSAPCGIRAIWVLSSSRRKGIATQLLDALRKNFCKGFVLEPSQCAFSHPTKAGRALASSYCSTESFLVYHASTPDG